VPLFWGDEYRKGYCQPPVTPGHEFVGEKVPKCYPLAIDMLVKKQVPVAEIVTHTFPLEQFGKAFQLVLESKDSIKVMLEP
jgi:Zn-dependent alcohol dehydrogenase